MLNDPKESAHLAAAVPRREQLRLDDVPVQQNLITTEQLQATAASAAFAHRATAAAKRAPLGSGATPRRLPAHSRQRGWVQLGRVLAVVPRSTEQARSWLDNGPRRTVVVAPAGAAASPH